MNDVDLQKIFKQSYVEQLRRGVKGGTFIHLYESTIFQYSEKEVYSAQSILISQKTSLILPDDKSNYEFENSKLLHESYKTLTPLQASDVRLWTYLAHVDFYEYMYKRWSGIIKNTAANKPKYVLDHWFIDSPSQGNLIKHGISGLWWIAYLTYDETRADPYELTKLIFRTLDVTTRTLLTYKLARHRESVIGIMDFVQQNPELFKNNYQAKMRFVTKHLNQLGGTRPISYFKRDFFTGSLSSIQNKISLVK